MYPGNAFYAQQQAQLQRSLGELRALLAMHYDPARGRDEEFLNLEKLIKKFEDNVTDLIG